MLNDVISNTQYIKRLRNVTITPIQACWKSHSKTMSRDMNLTPSLQLEYPPLTWEGFP